MKQANTKQARPSPGVSRADRISDDGLERLRRQLSRGINISQPVLQQWVRRYGNEAAELIREHGYKVTVDEHRQRQDD